MRIISGEFPDFSKFFIFDGETVQFSEESLDNVNTAALFTEKENPIIFVELGDGKMTMRSRSISGTFRHTSDLHYSGPILKFSINPRFFQHMLSYSTTFVVSADRVRVDLDTEKFSIVSSIIKEG